MNFVKAVLKDKVSWLLMIIFFVSIITAKLSNGLFILLPLIVFLLFIFVWPYIEPVIPIIRTIKNMLVKKKVVENKNETTIKDVALGLELSFFRGVLDFVALLFILISLLIISASFIGENFDSHLFYTQTFLYFMGVFIYMISRHMRRTESK
jgi:hypothetical protein